MDNNLYIGVCLLGVCVCLLLVALSILHDKYSDTLFSLESEKAVTDRLRGMNVALDAENTAYHNKYGPIKYEQVDILEASHIE
jgi:hypothetical protein